MRIVAEILAERNKPSTTDLLIWVEESFKRPVVVYRGESFSYFVMHQNPGVRPLLRRAVLQHLLVRGLYQSGESSIVIRITKARSGFWQGGSKPKSHVVCISERGWACDFGFLCVIIGMGSIICCRAHLSIVAGAVLNICRSSKLRQASEPCKGKSYQLGSTRLVTQGL